MAGHVCPWWGGYFIDNPVRRWLHDPETILGPFVQPGMVVADIGCGMGIFAIAMARLVGECGRVIAVDIQQQMLDVLSKRASAAGVADRITPHRCEPTSLGLSETLDLALAFYSLHEVPDLQRLLGEVYSCIRSQGKFLVVEPKGHVTARQLRVHGGQRRENRLDPGRTAGRASEPGGRVRATVEEWGRRKERERGKRGEGRSFAGGRRDTGQSLLQLERKQGIDSAEILPDGIRGLPKFPVVLALQRLLDHLRCRAECVRTPLNGTHPLGEQFQLSYRCLR